MSTIAFYSTLDTNARLDFNISGHVSGHRQVRRQDNYEVGDKPGGPSDNDFYFRWYLRADAVYPHFLDFYSDVENLFVQVWPNQAAVLSGVPYLVLRYAALLPVCR